MKNDVKNIWSHCLETLSQSVSQVNFDLWLKTLEPLCINEGKFVLVTPKLPAKKLINENFLADIRTAIACYIKSMYINEDLKEESSLKISDVEIIAEIEKQEYLSEIAEKTQDNTLSDVLGTATNGNDEVVFIPKYTFENFVIAESNKLVTAAAKAVAESPGARYNPLFIYGGVGLGKTHIMHAIGNYITEHNPKLNVIYVTTEKFTNEFIDFIRDNKDSRIFREKYRKADVLMLDDVQFMSGKTGVQENVFHTFNDLYQSGKQIIMSSDRPPKEIPSLEERLRSRFLSGFVTDIPPYDFESRVAILKKKALQERYNVDPVVINLIAEKITSNVREMEGALNRVASYSTLVGKPASLSLANDALKDYMDVKRESLSAYDIIDACCNFFNVSKSDLIGKKRTTQIVEPRQIAIYMITEKLSMPLISIGQLFGGRDHTTIMHARDRVEEKLVSDERMRAKLNDIEEYLKEVKK